MLSVANFRFCHLINLLLGAFLVLPAAAQTPEITAESYILLDAETGSVLAENKSDEQLPPASLAKIMSTYVFFQALQDGVLELMQPIVISENAWASRVTGSKMFIEVNTEVAVQDLLRGVIIQSGNDAAIALAEAVAGDQVLFAEMMNSTAVEIGMKNSQFQNATGLPAKEQYSSARDMALLVRETVHDFPDLYQMYKEKEFTYNNIRQENRNRLLNKFPGTDGVKTGYTKAAGYCLAASAVKDGRRLISVVMKTASPSRREQETIKLLTFGFNNFHNVRLFSRRDEKTLPIWGGAAEQVRVSPAKDGIYTLPRRREAVLRYEPAVPITAPVEAGAQLGELLVIVDDSVYERVPVLAAEAVAEGNVWQRWSDYFKINWLGHGDALLSQW